MTKKVTAFVLAVVLLLCGMQTQAYTKTSVRQKEESMSLGDFTGQLPLPNGMECGRQPFLRMEIPRVSESIDAVGFAQFEGGLKEETQKQVPEWERYSSKLVYNRLNSTERAFWDEMSELGYCYLLEEKDASDFGAWCGSDWVAYEGIDSERAKNILFMFLLSNPQFYFFQPGYSEFGTEDTPGLLLLINKQFANGKERAAVTEEFRQEIDSWLVQLKGEETDLEKEIAIHDMICNKVSYDYNEENIMENQTAYSVFFTDATVCAGYSQAMQLLCNAVGIPCASVVNQVHQWNLVRIHDTWYYTDLTWDDDEKGPLYRYFNRSMEVMIELEDGLAGNAGEGHIPHTYWEEFLPASTKDSGADWDDVGTVYVPEVRTAAPKIIIEDGRILIESPLEADIYYTTDGTSPSVASSKAFYYTEGFEVESGTEISAMAVQDGCWDSEIVSAEWKKPEPEPEPEPKPEPTPEPLPLPRVYEVAFETDGGSAVDSQNVADGETVRIPSPPMKEGYVFAGWYTAPDFAAAYSFDTPVSGNLKLYAKWEAAESTVKLNANGGYIGKKSVKSKDKKVKYGSAYGSLPSAKRKGYVFLGWYTKKNNGSRVTAQDIVTLTEDTVLYARFCKVAPKKASVASLKSNAPGKMVLRIKDSRIASGYQIRYSRKASMASAKTVKTQECEKQIAKLKKGKKYYVQVRMYQKDSVSGEIFYGAWSKKARVKIKK